MESNLVTLKLIEAKVKNLFLQDEEPQINDRECRNVFENKSILITGAVGSIGSELCSFLLLFQPRQLLMLDNNESGLHDLMLTLTYKSRKIAPLSEIRTEFIPIVGDVANYGRMKQVFSTYCPQIIFHVAAYKHVHLSEQQPYEVIRVNVLGTLYTNELAYRHAVERFTFISTDKAVNPKSIMGATKRLGELIVSRVQPSSKHSRLNAIVRFCNVLGSRGSVLPTFMRQIEFGGPLTLTHPDATRYFISSSFATKLVILATCVTRGNELFMPKIEQSIRIADLAREVIAAHSPGSQDEYAIEYIGLRPGEKLHEEFQVGNGWLPTSYPNIYRKELDLLEARDENLQHTIIEMLELGASCQDNAMLRLLWKLAAAPDA